MNESLTEIEKAINKIIDRLYYTTDDKNAIDLRKIIFLIQKLKKEEELLNKVIVLKEREFPKEELSF